LLNDPQQHDYYVSEVKGSSNDDSTPNTISNRLINQNNVEVKFANTDKIDTNTALVIADSEKMVAIEFDDEASSSSTSLSTSQPNLLDSIRFATHTNSESSIMSHTSIFERLWIESEMKYH
jgi:hypothetical protein